MRKRIGRAVPCSLDVTTANFGLADTFDSEDRFARAGIRSDCKHSYRPAHSRILSLSSRWDGQPCEPPTTDNVFYQWLNNNKKDIHPSIWWRG